MSRFKKGDVVIRLVTTDYYLLREGQLCIVLSDTVDRLSNFNVKSLSTGQILIPETNKFVLASTGIQRLVRLCHG